MSGIRSEKNERVSPLILVLGGVHGVGKTTLAHELSIALNIYQRAGLGAVTKTIKTLLPDHEVVKTWGQHESPEPSIVSEKFHRECELIGRVMHTLVESTLQSGEDYIVDGVQLLPQYLPLEHIRFCVITVPDAQEYERRFLHPTVTRAKHLTNATLNIVRVIEEIILQEARRYNVPIFDNIGTPQDTVKKICEHFSL